MFEQPGSTSPRWQDESLVVVLAATSGQALVTYPAHPLGGLIIVLVAVGLLVTGIVPQRATGSTTFLPPNG